MVVHGFDPSWWIEPRTVPLVWPTRDAHSTISQVAVVALFEDASERDGRIHAEGRGRGELRRVQDVESKFGCAGLASALAPS